MVQQLDILEYIGIISSSICHEIGVWYLLSNPGLLKTLRGQIHNLISVNLDSSEGKGNSSVVVGLTVLGELLKEDNSGLFMMMKVRLELPG
jgi:hypothetical protein